MTPSRRPPGPGPDRPGESDFLAAYARRRNEFDLPAVTADAVLLTVRDGQLSVLLVQRAEHPYRGYWALPGGFVGPDEPADAAALRRLAEETGVAAVPEHLEQLRTYDAPGRDPRMRVFSIAYLGLLPGLSDPAPGAQAAAARFWPLDTLPLDAADTLAFDHAQIIADGVERARAKLEYTSLATAFVDEPFSVGDLRRVYEAVWGEKLHPANFRRKVLATPGFVVPTGDQAAVGRGAGAALYRRGTSTTLQPAILRRRPTR